MMLVRQRPHDVGGVVAADERFVLEQSAQGFDLGAGAPGEVGDGVFL